jgi:hypothetical protein
VVPGTEWFLIGASVPPPNQKGDREAGEGDGDEGEVISV